MNNSLGDIIRELRKKKKLTQEELADGICSSVSISRIESGIQMPSSSTLEKILAKLDASTYQICNIYYKNEREKKFDELSEEALNRGDLDYAKSVLAKLNEYEISDMTSRQVLNFLNGTIALLEKKDCAVDCLKEALFCTKPSLDFSFFRNVLLSYVEANILSVISIAYYQNGNLIDAVMILRELLEALKNVESTERNYGIIRINVSMNLASLLTEIGKEQDALTVVEEAEKWALDHSELTLMPELEFVKAKVLYKSGKIKKTKKISESIIPYLNLIGKQQFARVVQQFSKNIII